MATKILSYAKLPKFVSEIQSWVNSAITKAVNTIKSGLKLEDISDVEASATEVNYLKGVTSGVQTQLNAKAPLASPEFTGTPTAPTATSGTNTTQVATTAFVKDAVETAVSGVKADLGSALTYKGSVEDYDSLPKSGQAKGDTYNVVAANGNTPAGTNYAWDGEKWDPLGGDIDLSAYALTATVNSQLGNKADKSEITDMATQTWVGEQDFLKESDFEEITDTEIENLWKED